MVTNILDGDEIGSDLTSSLPLSLTDLVYASDWLIGYIKRI
jgi:hypothetical protein